MLVRDVKTENEFQTEMQKFRRHRNDMVADMLPEPTIWIDAKRCGIPYNPSSHVSDITATFVLLLRVPESLAQVGIHVRVAPPDKRALPSST